jgi:hypothetical protein
MLSNLTTEVRFMPGQLDAGVKLLYAADKGTTITADTVDPNVDFEVLADIEIGEILHGFGGTYDLHLTVRNLSTGGQVYNFTKNVPVPAAAGTFTNQERVLVPSSAITANAKTLDALDAVAVLRYTAGVNTDFSVTTAQPFIVA